MTTQQEKIWEAYQRLGSGEAVAREMGIDSGNVRQAIRRESAKWRADPVVIAAAKAAGVDDVTQIRHGWSLVKDENGNGHSVFWKNAESGETRTLADAILDAVSSDIRLPKLAKAPKVGKGKATMMGLADLHIGRNYGTNDIETDLKSAVDDIISRLPPAEKAFLIELGDLLDANDHKGVTPSSGNPCDVIRHDHLHNTQVAIRLMKYAITRLAETHATVEVHMIPGNHDPTAYMAVLLALKEAFHNSKQIIIHVPATYSGQIFRVLEWGSCGLFPHHGHNIKWPDLKDVWSDQFPESWARCKAHRAIWTAHLHHFKSQDLTGCEAKHFRTIAKRQAWELESGYFSRGTLTAETWDKDLGYITGTHSHVVAPRLEEMA